MADNLNQKRKKRRQTEKPAKRPRTSSKKKPGFDKDIFKETEFYIKDGLRHVKPYPFTFTTYCKGRWLHRKLIDVLSQEFQAENTEYYKKAIENGNITVNGAKATEDVILKDNDIINHKVHRHEPPVTAEAIQIIAETEDILVVNKPSSIPIHPCGRYRHNTLVFLLGRELGYTNLRTIHRIDRLTSGIVMFAKSLEKARELEKQLREHELEKEYVCKVQGEFPSGVLECNEPISVVSHKVGVCRVEADGKVCKTVFTRETFDGTNSIVRCQPFSGRMHQIRVHLQWLGYPIINDPIYNHEAWGKDKGKAGVNEESVWKVIKSITSRLRNNDSGLDQSQSGSPACSTTNDESTELSALKLCDEKTKIPGSLELDFCDESKSGTKSETLELTTEANEVKLENTNSDITQKDGKTRKANSNLSDEQVVYEKGFAEYISKSDVTKDVTVDNETSTHIEWKQDKVPGCTECQIKRRNPTPSELTMCLHAAEYKGPDWEFRCPWPSWALTNMDTQNV